MRITVRDGYVQAVPAMRLATTISLLSTFPSLFKLIVQRTIKGGPSTVKTEMRAVIKLPSLANYNYKGTALN